MKSRKRGPESALYYQSSVHLVLSVGFQLWQKLLVGFLAGLIVSGLGANPAIGQTASQPYELNPALLELPVGRWVKIHQQRFSDSITFKRQRHGGSAFDSRRGQIVLFGSDTHQNKTWLNSPLFFDLAKLEWRQFYPADPLVSYQVNSDGLPVAGPNGDHPWAMHTFGAVTYDPNADAIVVASYPEHLEPGRFTYFLESLWPQVKRHPTWALNLESGKWKAFPGDRAHFFVHGTTLDAQRGIVLGYRIDGIHELSLTSGKWRHVAENGLLGSGNSVVFDNINDVLIAYGGRGQSDDVVVFEPAAGEHKRMPTPGLRTPGGRYVPMAYHSGLAQTVAVIDRPPEKGSGKILPTRADTWLYEYGSDTWTLLEGAELPFAVGMNFNLEFDPGHRLLLFVATPNDQPLPAVWALKIDGETRAHLAQTVNRSTQAGSTQPLVAGAQKSTLPAGSKRTINVSSPPEMIAAIAGAKPGDTILLAPGRYSLNQNLIDVVSAGHANNPITLMAERLDDVVIEWSGKRVEGFRIASPYWNFQNLNIRGVCVLHSQCQHSFHIVGKASGTVIRNNRASGFNATVKGNGIVVDGARVFPDDVLIENNHFFNHTPRDTTSPVTLIDVVGGQRWVVRGNTIHDFAKSLGNEISYGMFLKGNSRGGVFERNLIVCELLHNGGRRVGSSLGGGGTAQRFCPNNDCSHEHNNGIIRNNVIMNCPEEVGIYLNKASKTKIYNNTLVATQGIDVNFKNSTADIRNNIITGRIRNRNGGWSTRKENKTNIGELQLGRWFKTSSKRHFELRDGFELVDRGQDLVEVRDDFCGNERVDKRPDIGAFEYSINALEPSCNIADRVSMFYPQLAIVDPSRGGNTGNRRGQPDGLRNNAARPSNNNVEQPFIGHGKAVLRRETSEVVWKGASVQLTPQEYSVLTLMLDHPNEILRDAEIYAAMDAPTNIVTNDTDLKRQTKNLILGMRRKFRAVDSAFASIVSYPSQGFGWRE